MEASLALKRRQRHLRNASIVAGVAGLITLAVYWRTCHPTITWWDSAQYSLAANTFGVVGAPGSLLLTLLGWVATRLPLGVSSALALNLLAGAFAAATIALTVRVACALHEWRAPASTSGFVLDAIALGALPFAFGPTLWEYAIQFTPYVLTALFTAIILLALVRWWRIAADGTGARWLFILALLVGLDFSVHRTNALLLPGIVFWMLLRRPRAIVTLHAWLAGVGGMLVGLSAQLLLIPMAARSPALNMGDPSSLSRLWDYAPGTERQPRKLLRSQRQGPCVYHLGGTGAVRY